jgi:hypothetical protein
MKRTPMPGRRSRMKRSRIASRGTRGRRFKMSEPNEKYREYVRREKCVVAGRANEAKPGAFNPVCWYAIEAHHVTTRGAGGRDEANLAPLCLHHHHEIHAIGRRTFAKRYGVDLASVAARLWTQYQAHHGEDA